MAGTLFGKTLRMDMPYLRQHWVHWLRLNVKDRFYDLSFEVEGMPPRIAADLVMTDAHPGDHEDHGSELRMVTLQILRGLSMLRVIKRKIIMLRRCIFLREVVLPWTCLGQRTNLQSLCASGELSFLMWNLTREELLKFVSHQSILAQQEHYGNPPRSRRPESGPTAAVGTEARAVRPGKWPSIQHHQGRRPPSAPASSVPTARLLAVGT
jgi:hypothetical protein